MYCKLFIFKVFLSGRLDYCNSVLYGVTENLYQRLQSVENAAVVHAG